MSNVRFVEELGAEFERIAADRSASAIRRRREHWVRVRKHAAGVVVIALSLAVVVGVGAAVLATRARGPSGSAAGGRGATIVFRASALGPRVALGPAMERSIGILRLRLSSVFPGVEVSRAGSNIVVRGVPSDSRTTVVALAAPAQLEFYDWEANVLLPNGRTVASLGPDLAHNRKALAMSEGAGGPSAGSASLYDAVELASRQPAQVSADNARQGPQYYVFGRPGSAACANAAKYYGYTQALGEHCLLAGPDSIIQAHGDLPEGIARSQSQVLAVPQGTVVLEAVPSSFSSAPKIWNPSARFYVLKDHAALSGSDITNPHQSTDQSGAPDVTFGFTSKGKIQFQRLTADVARRGAQLSGLYRTDYQHFAVALDQRLVTLPQIDFPQYPNGIIDPRNADITGGFTTQSAKTVATLLRFGPLPVRLVVR